MHISDTQQQRVLTGGRVNISGLVLGAGMLVEVIEDDGDKVIIIPDGVLEQCNIEDTLDISVESNHIVLKACQPKEMVNKVKGI